MKGLVKASKIKAKLQKFLQDASEGKSETLGEGESGQPQLVADVAAVLEEHDARHVAILETLSQNDKVPPAALAKIRTALENAQLGKAKGQTIAALARVKAGPPSSARGGIFGKGKKTTKAPKINPGQAKKDSGGDALAAAVEEGGKPDSNGDSDKGGKPESAGKSESARKSGQGNRK